MKKTPTQEILKNDIMCYKTNKLPASLALLAIVFNCLYFCLLYGFRSKFFSTWEIGISVILTLFTLLISFLASEGIKGYKKRFCIVLLVLAAVQIIRMFGLPLEALRYDLENSNTSLALETRYFGIDMQSTACYIMLVIWLAASAACLIASAIIGYLNCVNLENYKKKIDDGEIDIDKVLKDVEVEEAASAAGVQSDVKTEEVQDNA